MKKAPKKQVLARRHVCDEVLIAIRRIIQSIDLHSRYLVKNFGLTGPQLIILQEVSRMGEISISELSKSISLGQATITGILERLENRGLITRRRSKSDKRKVFIKVTKACDSLLDKAPPPMQENFIENFENLQDWEQSMILGSLQRIVGLLDAKAIDVAPILVGAGPIDEAKDKLLEETGSIEDKVREKFLIEAETKMK
jgi:DNA-binding MarR family transcriptional regulator